MRSLWVVLLALGTMVASSGLAAAQGAGHAVELPGVTVGAGAFISDLAPAPSTPVDDVPGGFDELHPGATVGPFNPIRFCTVDDVVIGPVGEIDDVVPCRLVRHIDPCLTRSALDNLRQTPYGGPVADAVEDAAMEVDGTVEDALHDNGLNLPSDVQDALDNVTWGDASHRYLTECDADVQSADSTGALNNSLVFLVFGVNVTVCPYPELIPICEPVSAGDALSGTLNGTSVPVASNGCAVRGYFLSCGNVTVLNQTVEPVDLTHSISENLTALANATLDSNQHLNASSPGVTGYNAVLHSGEVHCVAGGLPPNSGVIPGAFSAAITLEPNGGQLPLNLHGGPPVVMAIVEGAVNGALLLASQTWFNTANAVIAAFNNAWETQVLHDNLHPNHNGHPGHSGCIPKAPSYTITEIPPGSTQDAGDVGAQLPRLDGAVAGAPGVPVLDALWRVLADLVGGLVAAVAEALAGVQGGPPASAQAAVPSALQGAGSGAPPGDWWSALVRALSGLLEGIVSAASGLGRLLVAA